MLTTFILSQVGERQNELVYSTDLIDKDELSSYLYSLSGSPIDKPSFFRCFRMHRETVLAYYWKTTYTEVKSGRGGLFVIIGFLFDNELLHHCEPIIDYSRHFLVSLQDVFGVSFQEPVSDRFFSQLQYPVEDMLLQLHEQLIPADAFCSKHTFRLKQRMRYRMRKAAFPQALYCIDGSDFFIRWMVFAREALAYVRRGFWDISSLADTTPASFQVLCNGDLFPTAFSRLAVRRYRRYLYIIIL